ncbi:MAG: DUF1592 domain-containing protein [Myxococcales bacterium]|nr:DUF1592 domain-containing protein [Myxococcales bacterium]
MRRLTREEYDYTVSDLLGTKLTPARAFPREETVKGFDNNASQLSFPGQLAEQALSAAASLAQVALSKAGSIEPCASSETSEACGKKFIETFGRRAWRRPLTGPEVDRLMGVFALGDTFTEGLDLALQSLLISAPFLYRIETPAERPRPASSWDMASRLSYLLWKSMPDGELMDVAAADGLQSKASILAQAERMLKDPKAERTFAAFNAQLMELPRINTAAKDPKVFPKWDNDYPRLLRDSAEAFMAHVVKEGTFADLFTADFVFTNDQLSAYYGVDKPGTSEMTKVSLNDPKRSAGLLTQGGVIASHSGFTGTSPTFMGRWVRERLLCGTLPPPPPEVNVMIGPAPPNQTTREHHAAHNDNPDCVPCHRLMDPIGYAFEEYDAIGVHRTTENGKPVDPSGEAVDSDVGTFVGATQLGEKLAASTSAQSCLATQWFRYAQGRLEEASDKAALEGLLAAVRDTGTYKNLLLKTVQSAPFLQASPPQE